MGDIRQQQRKGVLGLVELFLQIEQSCTYIIIGSFGLRQGSFGHHSRCFHGTGGGDALFPGSFRSGGDFDLGVEHQQGKIVVGHGGNQLGLHRLFIISALGHDSLGTTFGIGQSAKDIYLPTGTDGQ